MARNVAHTRTTFLVNAIEHGIAPRGGKTIAASFTSDDGLGGWQIVIWENLRSGAQDAGTGSAGGRRVLADRTQMSAG
jgi:hypothetical protein